MVCPPPISAARCAVAAVPVAAVETMVCPVWRSPATCVSQERLTLDTAPVDGRSVGLATTGTIQGGTVNGHACFWVETSDGTAVSLVWPEGATAASEPLRVEDRDGVTIASVGDEGTKLGGIPSDEPGGHASTTRFIIAP